jgi:hypothetical protein
MLPDENARRTERSHGAGQEGVIRGALQTKRFFTGAGTRIEFTGFAVTRAVDARFACFTRPVEPS